MAEHNRRLRGARDGGALEVRIPFERSDALARSLTVYQRQHLVCPRLIERAVEREGEIVLGHGRTPLVGIHLNRNRVDQVVIGSDFDLNAAHRNILIIGLRTETRDYICPGTSRKQTARTEYCNHKPSS